ncbi:N-formylglutamate amidohydrolase [candidate division CSSED10-310 bacterium]|uniref:N-formylglutamate amidohydrolase n=1 Tax=candidate division CSSED10-310 bacterium TaxID=2855610 RepID=A0ABV6YXD9_UNCC1
MKKLPFFISIPHGGTETPDEVKERICIGQADILEDGDAFTMDIYDVSADVRQVLKANIARAFVDLNRAEDDLPPENPDGVVKSSTCYSKPIYLPGQEPDDALIETLLTRFHRPYHRAIGETLTRSGTDIVLALDCHSMAALGPDIAPDTGKRRPLFCLGNRHGKTCPMETTHLLADCLRQAFDLEESDVTLNQPFAGGYITRTYGANPVPWIQVEMSRDLFLRQPYFDRETWLIDSSRLRELRSFFQAALQLFFKLLQR